MSLSWQKNQYVLPETNNGMEGHVIVCIEMEGKTQRPVTVYVSTNDYVGTATGLLIHYR